MFLERHVFRRCVLNEFRSRFQWKIVCSGGAQDLKTVEILVRVFGIQRNVRKPWKFKVHLTLPTKQNGDFHCHATVDMWKSKFFKNRSGAYIVNILEVFGVAQRVKRDARGGSSGALWNVWAMPKTSDFVIIQARERLRQEVKSTCIFMQNTAFIDILAPNGFPTDIWKQIQKFKVHIALLATAF